MDRPRVPHLVHNSISLAGAILAVIMGLIAVIMLIINVGLAHTNAYFGIFLYMVLPALLIFGLLLIPIGMMRQWRRWQRGFGIPERKWPLVDLNIRRHRNATIFFLSGTLVFLTLSAVGSYQAYHFTESVTFCGTTCHKVMEPEYTTYLHSPHAHVACAQCHVGYGASWYAKSKLSGSYQVYATLLHKYPRPIPVPVHNLRPIRQTCEECHWPDKTYGTVLRKFTHYMYDDSNSRWSATLMLKTDTGEPGQGQRAGIHWHINRDIKIEYIARDEGRQDITWIRVTDKAKGTQTLYQDADQPLDQSILDTATIRTMDCIDCHNCPSHRYNSPDYAIDLQIQTGHIDRSLPNIKSVAVSALSTNYSTKDSALAGIAMAISSNYQSSNQKAAVTKARVNQAISGAQTAFSQNFFPYMKVRWSDYPNNVGHHIDRGCFRCHDGSHQTAEGNRISHDCTACHTILLEGPDSSVVRDSTGTGLRFKHPVDIDEAWTGMGCYECHDGTEP